MHQVAIFVDAGYLFAAGSALAAGSKQPRESVTLDIEKAVQALTKAAALAAPDVRLLRIYWYDGIRPYHGPSPEQSALGLRPNIKLRLGMINSHGQQKGVDSLIVTDLIDLARNNAISDAMILAGDEDLRVGVQVAQTYGVRIHLLGIEPSRGNQSQQLLQEVDGHSEWTKPTLKTFITCKAPDTKTTTKPVLEQPSLQSEREIDFETIIREILTRFDATQMTNIKNQTAASGSLPREVDAPILAQARHSLGRDLTTDEKRKIRRVTLSAVNESA